MDHAQVGTWHFWRRRPVANGGGSVAEAAGHRNNVVVSCETGGTRNWGCGITRAASSPRQPLHSPALIATLASTPVDFSGLPLLYCTTFQAGRCAFTWTRALSLLSFAPQAPRDAFRRPICGLPHLLDSTRLRMCVFYGTAAPRLLQQSSTADMSSCSAPLLASSLCLTPHLTRLRG